MVQTTPRYGWRTPNVLGADNNVPVDLRQLAMDVEEDLAAVDEQAAAAAQHGEGLLSARGPAAGNAGHIWTVKGDLPLLNGQTYISDGTIWVPLADQAPVGSELTYWGTDDPPGYLIEDHREVSRAVFARLFAKIGTSAGAGNGTTTFNIPDGRGRVLVGLDPSVPAFNALGKTGGEVAHTLTVAESASHGHSGTTGDDTPDHGHSGGSHSHGGATGAVGSHGHGLIIGSQGGYQTGTGKAAAYFVGPAIGTSTEQAGGHAHGIGAEAPGVGAANARHEHPVTVGNTGGGGPHNNLQPYSVRNVIIKI